MSYWLARDRTLYILVNARTGYVDRMIGVPLFTEEQRFDMLKSRCGQGRVRGLLGGVKGVTGNRRNG